mmetsp:Transcript_14185/g.38060  ORF Transcript_14185/g.38060 Transcript_14185/m.38060 type:complete len:130 (+) Transcript_14185:609-998(+)
MKFLLEKRSKADDKFGVAVHEKEKESMKCVSRRVSETSSLQSVSCERGGVPKRPVSLDTPRRRAPDLGSMIDRAARLSDATPGRVSPRGSRYINSEPRSSRRRFCTQLSAVPELADESNASGSVDSQPR